MVARGQDHFSLCVCNKTCKILIVSNQLVAAYLHTCNTMLGKENCKKILLEIVVESQFR